MSERARIMAWWGYVLCVVAIFEVVFLRAGFAFAVLAALISIVVLGSLLKLVVGTLSRGARAQQDAARATGPGDGEEHQPGSPI